MRNILPHVSRITPQLSYHKRGLFAKPSTHFRLTGGATVERGKKSGDAEGAELPFHFKYFGNIAV